MKGFPWDTSETHQPQPLLALERERCFALTRGDLGKVASLMSPGLIYVHSVGIIHDRDGYLRFIRDEIRLDVVDRRELNVVSTGGNVAWMTGLLRIEGRLLQSGKPFSSVSFASQVWTHSDDRWQLELFHSTQVDASRW
ncbi:nuclear transport factor 2 family protein [Pseudomonas sp. s4]|uniref:nuclear transport factor 2 family protein n=1 Tax=Pseudomonas sp. s4 TaxID=353218 RepID=UPI00398CF1C7